MQIVGKQTPMHNVKRVGVAWVVWFVGSLCLFFSLTHIPDAELLGFITGRVLFATAVPSLVVSYFAYKSWKEWSWTKTVAITSVSIVITILLGLL
jgi:hypothetical protein